MSFKRGTFSYKGSFLREPNLCLPVCGGFRDEAFFKVALSRNTKGELSHGRKAISEMMNKKDYRGHIMLNAINLKDYQLEDVLMYLDMFREYLQDELGLSGILECHAGKNPDGEYLDETFSSFHYHFWCDTTQSKNKDVRKAMAEWIVRNDLALYGNVNIQKYNAGKKINLKQLQENNESVPIGRRVDFNNTMQLKESKHIIVDNKKAHNLQEDEDGKFYMDRTKVNDMSSYIKEISYEYLEETIKEEIVFNDETNYESIKEENIVKDEPFEQLQASISKLKDLLNKPNEIKRITLPDQSLESFNVLNELKQLAGIEELDRRYEEIENNIRKYNG